MTKTASKADLSQTADAITTMVSKSQSDLTQSISRLAPKPPEIVKLQFGFYEPNIPLGSPPVLAKTVTQDASGIYLVEVYFTDVSKAPFEKGDIWIDICSLCSFASEAAGMVKPEGISELTRYKFVEYLNAGASHEKITIPIKSNLNPPFNFQIGFRYTCKACDPNAIKLPQNVTMLALAKPPA